MIAGIGHQRDETLADLAADVCAHTPTAAAEQAVPQLATLQAAHQERVLTLKAAMYYRLETAHQQQQSLNDRLHKLRLDRKLQQERQKLHWLRQRLIQGSALQIQQATAYCHSLQQKLATLDPEAVLKRGYAVARHTNGTIVRTAEAVVPGETLSIRLGQGQLTVTVTDALHDRQKVE